MREQEEEHPERRGSASKKLFPDCETIPSRIARVQLWLSTLLCLVSRLITVRPQDGVKRSRLVGSRSQRQNVSIYTSPLTTHSWNVRIAADSFPVWIPK